MGWKTKGSEFESRWEQEFSFVHVVQTGSGVQPASYLMSTGESFPGVKRPEREADHSPPTSAEVKKTWIHTFSHHTFSWRSAQLVKHGGNFTLPYIFLL
jgi:hypothetical protein